MKKAIGTAAVAALLVLAAGAAFAQRPPDAAGIPERGSVPDGLDIPEAPSGTVGPTVEKPAVPGIPSEARAVIPDADLVEVYCLMTKWKTGEFFAAFDALETHLIPAVTRSEAVVGPLGAPDIGAMRTKAQQRLQAVCGATDVDAANAAVGDLTAYGKEAAAAFDSLRATMSAKLKAKGDELRAKVEAGVTALADAEGEKAQAELDALAESLASGAQDDLEREMAGKTFSSGEEAQAYAASRAASIRSSVMGQVTARADALKKDIEAKVRAEADRLVGQDKAAFEALGKELGALGSTIDAAVRSGAASYGQYRTQAYAKRKALVLGFVDASIARAKDDLEKERGTIDAARDADPAVPSVDAIVGEIAADRAALSSALDAALSDENESAFQAAIDAFRGKWENYRSSVEKAFSGASAICAAAGGRIADARSRLDAGRAEIAAVRSRCATEVSQECVKVNDLAPRFDALAAKMVVVDGGLSAVETACKDPETADGAALVAMLGSLRTSGDGLDAYVAAFQKEKQDVIDASVADICRQVLPQLDAARVELSDDDLTKLRSNIERCKGSSTEECAAINGTSGEYAAYVAEVTAFLADADAMVAACNEAQTEASLLEMADLAAYLRSRGDALKASSKRLQETQASGADAAAVCSAATPRLGVARRDIARGVAEASALLAGCEGKSDPRCTAVNASAAGISEVTSRAKAALARIEAVISSCASGTADVGALLDELASLRAEEAEIARMVADLKGQADTRWPERIKSGKPFKVILDVAPSLFDDSVWTGDWRTDQMGTIRGGETYTVTYGPGKWSVTGLNEGTGRTGTWTYRYGDPDAYELDIWGRVYAFDKEGNVYDRDFGLVGHLSE